MKKNKPFRFVVLCDSLDLPKWQAECLKEVINSGLAVPVGFVINASTDASRNNSKWRSRLQSRSHLLWRLFNRLYVDVFCKATVSENMAEYFQNVSKFHDRPLRTGKFTEALTDEAITFVRNLDADFVLRFGFGILKGEILKIARFGVWSYHHGDPSSFRGQPPGFWEIYSGAMITGSILQMLTEELDGGTVLHSGFFQTIHQSYAKTRDAIYLGSSSWVRRTCAAIQENGWPLRSAADVMVKGRIWKQPNNLQMLRFLIITVFRFCRVQWTYRLFYQDWNCAVVPAPIHVVAGLSGSEEQEKALKKSNWMRQLPHCFAGDPFGFDLGSGSGIRILFELLDKRKNIGVVASVTYFDHKFSDIDLVMNSPSHLSYPFIMRDQGEIFFVPEHAGARNVSAFRLNEAGTTDHKVMLLPECELFDPTILHWNGKYWLFALDQSRSKNTDLHLYFAESWKGPWCAHPLNPVKTDVRSARPAGTPFVHEGKLYRPSQDCSPRYGSATAINEILILTESDFEERQVARVRPWRGSKYPYGLHTVSAVGDLTLIDGARKNFSYTAC